MGELSRFHPHPHPHPHPQPPVDPQWKPLSSSTDNLYLCLLGWSWPTTVWSAPPAPGGLSWRGFYPGSATGPRWQRWRTCCTRYSTCSCPLLFLHSPGRRRRRRTGIKMIKIVKQGGEWILGEEERVWEVRKIKDQWRRRRKRWGCGDRQWGESGKSKMPQQREMRWDVKRSVWLLWASPCLKHKTHLHKGNKKANQIFIHLSGLETEAWPFYCCWFGLLLMRSSSAQQRREMERTQRTAGLRRIYMKCTFKWRTLRSPLVRGP